VHDDNRLHALWQHAGAYFHGHSVGGTNPALVQAMAAGAPIVARHTVHSREVLGTDAGEFIGPAADQIETTLRRLLESPERQEQLSRAAVRRAREAYSWESVNAAYERLLRSYVGGADDRIRDRAPQEQDR
jgi:glycosyltransferase involved in cell wall biosynthesis